jgi:nucleoid-associated protein YgaU
MAGLANDPRAWTMSLIVVTGVTLLARHPLARMIGTEVDTPAIPFPSAVAPAPETSSGGVAQALASAAVAVPTHAARNPFRALVNLDGRVLAPVPMTAAPMRASAAPGTGSSAATPPTSAIAAGATAAGACTGTSHRVAAGDTLWGLAARAVRSADSSRVTIAWHRLYAANRAVLGADPSLLQVGATLCVPAGI